MKKNFFATLIIAALIVVMSFTLTSCDFFNRGNGNNGSGSNGGNSNGGNGGDNGNDGDSVLNGLDASKLSSAAKNNVEAQELASKIDGEVFKNYRDNYNISVTREDFVNIIAEILRGEGEWHDPYRVYIRDIINYTEVSNKYDLYISDTVMYAYLKGHKITLEEYINNKASYNADESEYEEATGCYAFCEILYYNGEITSSVIEELQSLIDVYDSVISERGCKVTSGENILYICDDSPNFAFLSEYTIQAVECAFGY